MDLIGLSGEIYTLLSWFSDLLGLLAQGQSSISGKWKGGTGACPGMGRGEDGLPGPEARQACEQRSEPARGWEDGIIS